MKHLKSYKLFESYDEAYDEELNVLNDLVLELKDMNFDVDIVLKQDVFGLSDDYDKIKILINKSNKKFKIEEIHNSLVEIIDYMESCDWWLYNVCAYVGNYKFSEDVVIKKDGIYKDSNSQEKIEKTNYISITFYHREE
jgi:hypothetical protein